MCGGIPDDTGQPLRTATVKPLISRSTLDGSFCESQGQGKGGRSSRRQKGWGDLQEWNPGHGTNEPLFLKCQFWSSVCRTVGIKPQSGVGTGDDEVRLFTRELPVLLHAGPACLVPTQWDSGGTVHWPHSDDG